MKPVSNFKGNEFQCIWRKIFVQWWGQSPSTSVAWVRIPPLKPYVGWVCCWFSSLLQGFFVVHFSSLHKNQHFQWTNSHYQSVDVPLTIPIDLFHLLINPLTSKSAIWHRKSLRAQYWVNLYEIWTQNRSWRALHNGSIKSYPSPAWDMINHPSICCNFFLLHF